MFKIKIVNQGWLKNCPPEQDLCSHGHLQIVIRDNAISDDQTEYGISESALALLRTLESNHTREHPIADRLIFHGCGTILMMSCPIGINWTVIHKLDNVIISNVVRYPSPNEKEVIQFEGLSVDLSSEDYRIQIIDFAKAAKSFFATTPKQLEDDFDRKQYDKFWKEYDSLLQKYNGAA